MSDQIPRFFLERSDQGLIVGTLETDASRLRLSSVVELGLNHTQDPAGALRERFPALGSEKPSLAALLWGDAYPVGWPGRDSARADNAEEAARGWLAASPGPLAATALMPGSGQSAGAVLASGGSVVLAACSQANLEETRTTHQQWGFGETRYFAGSLLTLGALQRAVQMNPAAGPVLAILPGREQLSLFVVAGEGCLWGARCEVGLGGVYAAIQGTLKLRFVGSAIKLLYDGVYDFSRQEAELIGCLVQPVSAELAKSGRAELAPRSLYCGPLHSSLKWIAPALAKALQLTPWSWAPAGLKEQFRVEAEENLQGVIQPASLGWLELLYRLQTEPAEAGPWRPGFLNPAQPAAAPPAAVVVPAPVPIKAPEAPARPPEPKPPAAPPAPPAPPPPVKPPEPRPPAAAPAKPAEIKPPAPRPPDKTKPAAPAPRPPKAPEVKAPPPPPAPKTSGPTAPVASPVPPPAAPAPTAPAVVPVAPPPTPAAPTPSVPSAPPPPPAKPAEAAKPVSPPKPEPKAESKPEPKPEPKTEPKTPAKPEPKPQPKAEPKPAVKPAAPAPRPVSPGESPAEGKKKISPLVWVAVAALLLGGAGLAYFLTRQTPPPPPPEVNLATAPTGSAAPAEGGANLTDVRTAIQQRLEEERRKAAEEEAARVAAAEAEARRQAEEKAAEEARRRAEEEEQNRREQERLARARGQLAIESVPAGAQVWAGDRLLGETPLTVPELKLGQHEFVLRKRGYRDQTVGGLVEENKTTKADKVELFSLLGTLDLSSEPSGVGFTVRPLDATISLPPEQTQGRTPTRLADLLPGEYEVTWQREGWPEEKRTVTVPSRNSVRVGYTYRPGKIEIVTRPSGAAVKVDGREAGRSPVTLDSLPTVETTLELNLEGYEPEEVTVLVESDQTAAVDMELLSLERVVPASQLEESPKVAKGVMPERPFEKRRTSALIIVQCLIDKDGTPKEFKIVQSNDPDMEKPVLDALRSWKFTPGTRKGFPVRTVVNVPFQFVATTQR